MKKKSIKAKTAKIVIEKKPQQAKAAAAVNSFFDELFKDLVADGRGGVAMDLSKTPPIKDGETFTIHLHRCSPRDMFNDSSTSDISTTGHGQTNLRFAGKTNLSPLDEKNSLHAGLLAGAKEGPRLNQIEKELNGLSNEVDALHVELKQLSDRLFAVLAKSTVEAVNNVIVNDPPTQDRVPLAARLNMEVGSIRAAVSQIRDLLQRLEI